MEKIKDFLKKIQPLSVVDENDQKWTSLLNKFRGCNFDDHDIIHPYNFCKENDTVRILDYGSVITISVLEKGGLAIIESLMV